MHPCIIESTACTPFFWPSQLRFLASTHAIPLFFKKHKSEAVKQQPSSPPPTLLTDLSCVHSFVEAKDQTLGGYTYQNSNTQIRKTVQTVMVLPLLKLGSLALKTLSKPVAGRLKKEAGLHPRFRRFIVRIAQANHRLTTTMQRRIYGHATKTEIRPLNEEKAVQAAVDLLGEVFVFSVAGAALIFEVQRSSRSEAKKEALRRQELEGLRLRDEELAKEVELLRHKLEELEQLAKERGLAGVFNFRHSR